MRPDRRREVLRWLATAVGILALAVVVHAAAAVLAPVDGDTAARADDPAAPTTAIATAAPTDTATRLPRASRSSSRPAAREGEARTPDGTSTPPPSAPAAGKAEATRSKADGRATFGVTSAPAEGRGQMYATFERLADCESGDRVKRADGSLRILPGTARWGVHDRLHSGGLQFAYSTWRQAGGTKHAANAHEATKDQQIAIATDWLKRTSWAQWPVCSRLIGVR